MPASECKILQAALCDRYRILNLFDHTLDLADGIYGHHERWNGTGYPKKLKGEEIPFAARIIALAEHYDRKRSDGRQRADAERKSIKRNS